jgi:transcriptional regulator with XRE-family HTH domain
VGDAVGPDSSEAPKLRVVSSNENLEFKATEKWVDSRTRFSASSAHTPARADVYTSIGQCVALRRQERGISQREFAFSLGVKLSLLKNYEDGVLIFTPDLLLRAAQILEVEPSRFFVLLAEKRLADFSGERFPLEANASVVEESDTIRTALLETISKCDSIITLLDIIDVSKNI